MNSDGSNARALDTDPHTDRDPSVSPDGRYIFFSSDRAGPFNIWRIDADGGNPVQLTFGDSDEFPFCSPDGRWVVYQGVNGSSPNVWRVSPEGGESERVGDSHADYWPTVSPDSRFVAYMYTDERDLTKGGFGPIDGGSVRQSFDIPYFEQPLFIWQRLRWASDGSALTFIMDDDGTDNIWAVPLDGREARHQITTFPSDRLFYYDIAPSGSLVCVRGRVVSDAVILTLAPRSPS
jgi:tricorn protease